MSWIERQRTATIATVVASLLPAHPRVTESVRATVTASVVEFVVSQVGALPDFLRIPYGLGLLAFEYLPLARWGRPLGHLDAERRAAYIASWSDSPLGAARNFMKLMRSCALLAYYDHPALRSALEAPADTIAPLRVRAGRA
jgi:hypothetical protein